jgi:hypothetical protein
MRALERDGWLAEKEQGIQIAEAPNGQALMSISSARTLAYMPSRIASSTTLSELAGKTFMEGGGATPFRTSKPNAGEDVGFWKILVTLPITILSPAWRCGGGTRD